MNAELKVWWIPQIPMQPFEYPVRTIEEGLTLIDALGKYDLFQLENNVKPDYSNCGGLSWRRAGGTDDDWEDIDENDEDDIEYLRSVIAGREEAA